MKLYFGVELEILVRPRKLLRDILATDDPDWSNDVTSSSLDGPAKDKNRRALRKALEDVLSAGQIRADDKVDNWDSWSFLPEDLTEMVVPTKPDEYGSCWGMELVSRVFSTSQNWTEEVDRVFDTLAPYVQIFLSDGCSTHVHVSTASSESGDTRFTLNQLQNILKAVLVYDQAVTKIMPPQRKDNIFAYPNSRFKNADIKISKQYDNVKKATWAPLFDYIDRAKGNKDIQKLTGNENAKTKFTSWNFHHITEPCGTVEFRRPPGVEDSKNAKHWIAFSLGFIANALHVDWKDMHKRKDHPKATELTRFIGDGMYQLPPICREAFLPERMHENNEAALARSIDDIKNMKLQMFNIGMRLINSPYASKANSRANSPRIPAREWDEDGAGPSS